MNVTGQLALIAAMSLVAMATVVAQTTDPAEPAGASKPPSTPTAQYNCVLKTLNACTPQGGCGAVDNLKGEKLPVKVTVDLDVGIIAGVDAGGWVNATRITSLVRTTNEVILNGIDSAVAWQLLIYQNRDSMSLAMATAENASLGFGDCQAANEQ